MSSFWQGVDVVGDMLSCVIIDKLLFILFGDLIIVVCMDVIVWDGGSLFVDYQVFMVIFIFFQGIGCLIWYCQDCGVLSIFDFWMLIKGYGWCFLVLFLLFLIVCEIVDVEQFLIEKGMQIGIVLYGSYMLGKLLVVCVFLVLLVLSVYVQNSGAV